MRASNASSTSRVRDKSPEGTVIGQGPKPGMRVMVNYEVRLYVSTGPK
jgi:beta-lactam-binding protein with PASTA domain